MKIFKTNLFEKKSKDHLDIVYEIPAKLDCWYAAAFVAFWLILYFAVVQNLSIVLPDPLYIKNEADAPDRFIAERAQRIVLGLTSVGPHVVGSEANEVKAVNFILGEIEKVRAQASPNFEFETDVQVATGDYVLRNMINMYQGIQNIVVKMKSKGSTSESYLLINSHFDSAPDSPGGGDDGSMVAVMLEVMRVISRSDESFEHPFVFLFNGAEENPLQASHAFITQHKWAKNCKALINLDAAGNGGKEILFQSGPKHPWLMRYYRKNAPHPFASTIGEEMFQKGFIPSDTDFRIFRDYGSVPGLDLAYVYNDYVYHTEFDRFNIIPLASYQNTGDNVLAVAKAIANAPEMRNIEDHEDDYVIFYDFMGWFMLFYSVTVGIIINIVVCCVGLVAIGVSMFFMSARSGLGAKEIAKRFGITFALQLLSIGLGVGLTFLVIVFMDGVGRSLSWYSEIWLVIGLYFCPMFFGMGILAAFYSHYMKRDDLSLGFRIQMFMHAHCIIIVILTIVLMCMDIRTAFMPMIAVFFDIIALIINLITKWHRRGYLFAVAVIGCQILPFIYFTNMAYSSLYVLIPMVGRGGSSSNPEILIAVLCMFFSVLFAGFLIPLMLFFRKTRTLISTFLALCILFIIIAVTPAGFPYTPKTAAQRFHILHVKRILHNSDLSVRTSQSGMYIFPQDRRTNSIDDDVPGFADRKGIGTFCEDEMLCGLPHYRLSWHNTRQESFWMDFSEPNLPFIPTLKLVSKQVTTTSTARFQFKLTGTDHMSIVVGPQDGVKVTNWSFSNQLLEKRGPPYFIYYSYGKDSSPLEFFIDVERTSGGFQDITLELGVGAHWVHRNLERSEEYQAFLDSFPDWTTVLSWPASYESWLF